MTLSIKNVEYFEWEVPNEVITPNMSAQDKQDLIDEYFNPDDLSVDQVSDTYYEYNG